MFQSAGDQMKKIYLVDSENVGDIWVPLLVASQPDEEVIVFYTQKSPHMNYENVRLLKETDKEAKFIKCFEGSNALDFQLVTQLGYMLCENQENCYVIVSNDTGFDAAVRYWKQRNMPVQRISGKELSRRLQQKTKTAELLENSTEAATGQTAEFLKFTPRRCRTTPIFSPFRICAAPIFSHRPIRAIPIFLPCHRPYKRKNAGQPFLTDRQSQSLITHAQAFRLPLFHFPLISPI